MPSVSWLEETRITWIRRVAGSTFSPIDLIPGIIPVLGYLDDLVFIPLGVMLAIRLIPAPVWTDAQARGEEAARRRSGPLGAR